MKNQKFYDVDLKEKIAQMFIMGFSSDELSQKNINIQKIAKENLGGVILFSENIKSINQTKNLIDNLQTISKTPLFVSIDQEGGLIQRNILSKDKIDYLSPLALANTGCIESVKLHTDIISNELKSMGINMNFSPSLDVNTNSKNPIIGIRSYGNNIEDVYKYSSVVFKTFQNQDIIPVGKHFPGHGDSSIDSHYFLPTVEFNNLHLDPFKKAIKGGLDVMMIAHVYCSNFSEENTPASLCPKVIGHLKNKLGFNGLIVSDDMVMGGITEDYSAKEACVKGIEAGINTFIYRFSDDETVDLIEQLHRHALENSAFEDKINKSFKKIMSIKEKYGIFSEQKQDIVINKDNIKEQIDAIAKKSIIVKKKANLLPLEDTVILKPDMNQFSNIDNTDLELGLSIEDKNTIVYPLNPTKDDILDIHEKIKDYKQVIFVSYNALLNKGQLMLFKILKKSIISIILGTNDEVKYFDKANAIIIASCPRKTNKKAIKDKLMELFVN